ncbi:hypothetical protein Bca4012_065429 [Brassica carinata]
MQEMTSPASNGTLEVRESNKSESMPKSSTVQGAIGGCFDSHIDSRRSIDIMGDALPKKQKRPYVVMFVGVNRVEKSSQLAKVAYWSSSIRSM